MSQEQKLRREDESLDGRLWPKAERRAVGVHSPETGLKQAAQKGQNLSLHAAALFCSAKVPGF